MATTIGTQITLSATETSFTATGTSNYTINGNDLNNTLIGNAAANKIYGGIGTDRLEGNDGNDTLFGGDGNDTLIGGLGVDSMSGEAGNDTYYIDRTDDLVIEGNNLGIDLVYSSVSYTLPMYVEYLTLTGSTNLTGAGNLHNNRIIGNAANNVLTGEDGNDTLYGGLGEDTLWGGNGNDSLYGQGGQNELHGGEGDDSYYVETATDLVLENANEGSDSIYTQLNYTLGENFEHLVFSGNTNAVGHGNAANNTILGNNGNNQLFGEDGNDWLDGRAGVDTMEGGTGNDVYVIGQFGDTIIEQPGEGTDKVIYASGNLSDFVFDTDINVENVEVQNNCYSVVNANDLDNPIAVFGVGGDVHGKGGNDSITLRVDNTQPRGAGVYGDDGSDYIYVYSLNTGPASQAQAGQIFGGLGMDRIVLRDAIAYVEAGEGNDTIEFYNAAGSMVYGNQGNDTYVVSKDSYISGGTALYILEGINEGVDTIKTDATFSIDMSDQLNPRAGVNVVSFYDEAHGYVENLTLTGTDNINGYGNALNNTLFGNTGNNLIEGRDGNDVLVGHGGSDTLDGGNGNDMLMVLPTLPTGMTINPTGSTQLTGGAGNDVFRMNLGYVGNHTAGANQLSITDFVRGQDKLHYFLDASSTTPTSLNALTVGSGGALASLVDQAAASSASKAAPTLTAFAFSGNTYVVLDQSASATFDSSTDLAIKLVGEPALTLSDFSFAKAAAA